MSCARSPRRRFPAGVDNMTTLPQTSPMRLPRPNPSQLAIPSTNGHPVAFAATHGTTLTGADIWRILRVNLWLIIALLILSAIAGYFVNMWLNAKYARYTSTALIKVQLDSELPRIDDQSRTLISEPSPQSIELEQQSQAGMLTSPYFLGALLEDPLSPIRNLDWFKQFGNRVDDAKEDLLDK